MGGTDKTRIIAFDGNESVAGRALLCLSALYHCADRLNGVGLRLIDIADPNVMLAAEALHWDVGLEVDAWSVERAASEGSPLAGVDLYAGIAFRSARHMRLEEAAQRQIKILLAIQFPDDEWLDPSIVMRQQAAFDPQLFAEGVIEIINGVGKNGTLVRTSALRTRYKALTAGAAQFWNALANSHRNGLVSADPDVEDDTGLESALVDVDWYRTTYTDVAAAGSDPVWHYFNFGWREGRDPNAWFSTRWYLDRIPGVREAEESPLHHFVREGAHAGCRPHRDFDIAWYSAHYLGLDFPSHVALRHFLTIGERDGNAPAPPDETRRSGLLTALVDADWYRTTYPDLAADVAPAQHYFDFGWREGRDPNAWFATRWYLDQSPALKHAEESPLHDFVRLGACAHRRPHPDFDIAWYSRQHLCLERPSPDALHHFLTIGLAAGVVPNGGLNHRHIRARLTRQDTAGRSAFLKGLDSLKRAATGGKQWDERDAEFWPLLLASEVPDGRITVLVLHDSVSEAALALARLVGTALPMHEFPLFALIEGGSRLRILNRLDDPKVDLILTLPEQIAGLRDIALALNVTRAVVTDERMRHGAHVRWLRDAGIPVFTNGFERDA